jgi:hypothetical protein
LDGNGAISVDDLAAIKKHMLNIQSLSGAKLIAGKINRGNTITISDVLSIKKHLLELSLISQS